MVLEHHFSLLHLLAVRFFCYMRDPELLAPNPLSHWSSLFSGKWKLMKTDKVPSNPPEKHKEMKLENALRVVSAVTTAPHTHHRHFISCALLAACCIQLLCPIRHRGLNPLEDGLTLFVWQSLDSCQGPLTSSTHKNGNGDKGNQSWCHFPGKVFLWEVTMMTLLLPQLWSWWKASLLFLTKY